MAQPIWTAAVSFLAVTATTLVALSLATPRERATMRRIDAIADAPGAPGMPRAQLLDQPFFQRAVLPGLGAFAQLGARLTPKSQRERLVQRLQQAGLYGPYAIQAMLAFKALFLAVAVLAFWLLSGVNSGAAMMTGAIIALVGAMGPDQWITGRIKQRKDALVRSLPDTLDLVTSSVEAGLSFDGSVLRIVGRQSQHGHEIREELGRYMTDVRMGRTRPEALNDLSRRCGVSDLEGVVAALIQADHLGVGVGQVLRTQSLHLRNKRRQRAQETAMKAPIKMLFPLVFFIFPAMFIVTLGPAILRIMDTFKNMN